MGKRGKESGYERKDVRMQERTDGKKQEADGRKERGGREGGQQSNTLTRHSSTSGTN